MNFAPPRLTRSCLFALAPILLASAFAPFTSLVFAQENQPTITAEKAIAIGVERLLEIQNEDGSWPYEGVYRVNRKIPVGYRIGGTAICC